MKDIETYTQEKARKELDKDYKEAMHAQKLGKALVPRVLKMVEKGQDVKDVSLIPGTSSLKTDHQSTTMALNAELKAREKDIEATFYDATYDGTSQMLEINSIDGQKIRPIPEPNPHLDEDPRYHR